VDRGGCGERLLEGQRVRPKMRQLRVGLTL
jgi:hypothetical protein